MSSEKTKIKYSIDDDSQSKICLVDSSFTIQQALQFIQNKINDSDLIYVYIEDSLLEDTNDPIVDWINDSVVFNFRHSLLGKKKNPTPQSDSYDFIVYTSSNWESLINGQHFLLKKDMNHEQFEGLIKDYCSIQSHIPLSQIKLLTFLPGGIEFDNTTLREYVETTKPEKLHMYVVVSVGISSSLMNKEIVEICDVRDEMGTIFSPLAESTDTGKQLFACLLSSMFHQTKGRKEFITSISKITAFPPLISSLKSLIDRKAIYGKNLIMITSPLFVIFKYLLDKSVPDNKILESCNKLCNLISSNDEYSEIPFEIHNIDSTETTIDNNKLTGIEQYMQQKSLTTFPIWKPDFEQSQFQKTIINPLTLIQLQNSWENKQYFKPVMPLTLRQVHVSSIVYGPKESYRVFTMETADTKEEAAASKVDMIDPETGQTTHEDIEKFAKNVATREVEGEKVELIDEDSVQQITMVLIDQSGSMLLPYNPNDCATRDTFAKQLLVSWASKSFGYRISSLQGLISFSSDVVVKSELSPLTPGFENGAMNIEPDGCTKLWDAVKKAAEMLVDKKIDKTTNKDKFKKAVLRIVILTDGEDKMSDVKLEDIIPYLINNKIIVDTVIVALNAKSDDVCTLSQLTGGLAFKPASIEEGISLFEKEAFLNISYREKPRPFEGELTLDVFNDRKSNLHYDTEPKNNIRMQAQSNQPLLTPRAAIKGLDGTSKNRLKRISKELRIAYRWEDQDVKVYPVENLVDRWRVYIKGPDDTMYKNKWFDLFATFPDNYPYSPPIFRFITVPFHINISDEGRICMNSLGSDYSSSTNVMELIANIKALLIIPNYDDPIDIAKLTLYNKTSDHREFFDKVKESVKKGKKKVNEFLSKANIHDEKDYSVPQENYHQVQNRCPITGKPLEPANTVVASSGIRYDRDALRRLLLSSNDPKCVITGKKLTDKPYNL